MVAVTGYAGRRAGSAVTGRTGREPVFSRVSARLAAQARARPAENPRPQTGAMRVRNRQQDAVTGRTRRAVAVK